MQSDVMSLCRRVQGGGFLFYPGVRGKDGESGCRVQEECSRHGVVVLWVRVQRAGGAARGEGGELQGIGERARGQAGGDARAW